ncbi:hypothetical protein ABMA28_009376 [Loxostege sticticalis]|uniref:YqaJ viral recombinase domain-containing protein n=1 Tax=Loxostege sticticalis TaxID=481309 RepID=A0ABD0SD82_LOXSC
MTESGFVRGQSDNLPRIDAFMMSSYFHSNPNYTSAEVKGVKSARSERQSYGDAAIGYVQVKRDGSGICIVKARITPEHNVRLKCYAVTAICHENEDKIISVTCEDGSAHLGGCKHAVAFLAWLHRRSEDPPSTSVECYWKKSQLSSIGTSLKFIKAKDMCNAPRKKLAPRKSPAESFLSIVINDCKKHNNTDNQLMKYSTEPNSVEKLSIHNLSTTSQAKTPDEFIKHCKLHMSTSACEEAEQATLGQSDSSKAYEAAHCSVLDGSLTESIMGASKLRDTEVKRGRQLENEVIKEVEKKRKIKIKRCGLKLNPNYPVMGVSPDGESDDYSIEIKCPSTEKAMTQYIKSGNRVSPKCMAQVQLQMHFSSKKKALFCVAHSDFEKSKQVNILEVEYDNKLCENLLNKCILFWTRAIFPKLCKKMNNT